MIALNLNEHLLICLRFLLNYVSRFFLIGWVMCFCFNLAIQHYNFDLSWHIFLCTFAYVPLMAESMILYTGDDIWCSQLSRNAKNKVHGSLITLSTLMVIMGNSILFYYIEEDHLNTVHGVTGFVSMLLVIASWFIGLAVHNAFAIKNYVNIPTVWMKFLHNFIGLLAFAVGIISLCYSFYTHWFQYYTIYEERFVLVVFTVIGSVWAANRAFNSLTNQIVDISNNCKVINCN